MNLPHRNNKSRSRKIVRQLRNEMSVYSTEGLFCLQVFYEVT